MEGWDQQNPCFKCGACCKNVRISLDPALPLEASTGALYDYVLNPEKAKPLEENLSEGIHYIFGNKGKYYLQIAGKCPLLGTDGRCTQYSNRPKGCRDFVQGDGLCKKLTDNRGHSQYYVPLEGVAVNPQQKQVRTPSLLSRLLGL